jgi:hypothetical protein
MIWQCGNNFRPTTTTTFLLTVDNTIILKTHKMPPFTSNTHQAKIYTVNGGVAPGQNQPDWLGSTITRAHRERAKKKKKKAVGPGTEGKSLIQVSSTAACFWKFTCLHCLNLFFFFLLPIGLGFSGSIK